MKHGEERKGKNLGFDAKLVSDLLDDVRRVSRTVIYDGDVPSRSCDGASKGESDPSVSTGHDDSLV